MDQPATDGHVSFKDVFARHVFASFDKQMHLRQVIGSRTSWSFEMAQGTLSFGDIPPLQVQLVGTESKRSNTWLWAWANTASDIPGGLLEAVDQVRSLGHQHNIRTLMAAEMLLTEEVNGVSFGMVAAGEAGAHGFYRCPYEGGALYLLITDPAFPPCEENPLMRITRLVPMAVKAFKFKAHRQAALSYLNWYGLEISVGEQAISGRSPHGDGVNISFDEHGQFKAIHTGIDLPV